LFIFVACENKVLYGKLFFVGKFESFGREYFDAVILKGIVRCRYDDTGVSPHAACEKGNARRRHDADHNGIHSHGADSRYEGALKHIPGDTRIFSDNDLRHMTFLLEQMSCSAPDV